MGDRAMSRTQYRIETLNGDDEKRTHVLNVAASDGWSLVAVLPPDAAGGWPTAYLSREIPDEAYVGGKKRRP